MEDYKEIKEILRPRRDFAASDELRTRIGLTLDSHTNRKKPLRWILGLSASCVAAAVLMLVIIPTGTSSAKELLTKTLNTMLSSNGIEMKVSVRTSPMENFRYISLSENFVEHSISIARSDSTISWRIDKGGRTAIGNKGVIYNWIDQFNIGWRTTQTDPKELLGEMALFLNPEQIIETELQNCINNHEAHYSADKSDGDIILTVHSQPQGDFSNPYMLNASIAESENIRRYVIDTATKRLKSASVSIVKGKKETEVLKITDIVYGQASTNHIVLPSNVRFIDMPQTILPGLTGLTPSEAASACLNALETWNETILDKTIDDNLKNLMLAHDLKGSVLVSVGQSFTSGSEGTTFVPYTLLLPDGTRKCHNLALQKSSQGGWIVVGGL